MVTNDSFVVLSSSKMSEISGVEKTGNTEKNIWETRVRLTLRISFYNFGGVTFFLIRIPAAASRK